MNIHYGIVSAVDPAAGTVRVVLSALDNLPTRPLPVLQLHGTRTNKNYALPDEGEHVVCLLDKRCEDGVVLGSIYSSEDTPDPDNSGPGVYALKLVQNGAAVFLAVIRRAAAGAFSLWSKGSVKVESDTANIELKAGGKLKLKSSGKISVTAGVSNETLYALVIDALALLRDHKHVVAGTATTVLQPTDLATAVDLDLRAKTFVER